MIPPSIAPGRLLTVGRGNSSFDLLLHGDPPQRVRVSAAGSIDAEAMLAPLLGDVARAVGATSVSGGLDALEAVLARRGVRLELAGRDLPCPLRLEYPRPETLGVDRWVTAVAACRAYGDAVVVDCGTAVTVNAVTADGRFLGGSIGPGLRAMAHGLGALAPALPTFSTAVDVAMPAVSSAGGVAAGVTLGFAGAIERLVAEVRGVLGDAPVVVTGGDASVFLRHTRLDVRHEPDLLHQGLRCLTGSRSRG